MNYGKKYTLNDLSLYFLKLGTWGFGGPIALVGYMHRDLVESRQWISEGDFKDGLALAQLSPGPLAAQLSIYLGYVDYKVRGATLAGLAFIMPSFLMVVGIGYGYIRFGGLPGMQAMFYGVGGAVIAIIALSSYKLAIRTLGKERLLWSIFAVMSVVTFVTQREILWLMVFGGLIVWFVKAPPRITFLSALAIPPMLSTAATENASLFEIGWFFTKAGAFVFGSGLAIVPFLYGGLVMDTQWLTEQQFLDAVAVAMITPGPVVITVGFIGYLIDGFPGACVAAAATFLPCYLFTVIPAPWFRKYGRHPGLKEFVDGITAAVIGAIAGSVLVLGMRMVSDLATLAIMLGAAVVLLLFRKVKEPVVIALSAIVGIIIKSI